MLPSTSKQPRAQGGKPKQEAAAAAASKLLRASSLKKKVEPSRQHISYKTIFYNFFLSFFLLCLVTCPHATPRITAWLDCFGQETGCGQEHFSGFQASLVATQGRKEGCRQGSLRRGVICCLFFSSSIQDTTQQTSNYQQQSRAGAAAAQVKGDGRFGLPCSWGEGYPLERLPEAYPFRARWSRLSQVSASQPP